MLVDADAAYLALAARDARFDGRIFVGVTSTRIYCRPICRVRTPKRENCRFFDSAAQAEAECFRPCLKCRPEIAPGPGLPWSVMDASQTLARQAANRLDAQTASGDAPGLARLAAHLGVSDRHLRRIFHATHGVTPLQYVQTRRLLLAKQLLTDTCMPVAQVALASGFASLRRFNAAFAESYRMSPTRLRAQGGDRVPMRADAVTIVLAYRAPYDVARLMRFLARRAIPCVEQIAPTSIRRTLRAGVVAPVAGWIEARFPAGRAQVCLSFAPQLAPFSASVVTVARRWLDLDAAPTTIHDALAGLPGDEGLRLPGGLDPFELAVRAVLGQQVTVAAASTLARRFVERFGHPIVTPWEGLSRTFPSPDQIASTAIEHIAELGIVRNRAAAIVAIARAWPELEQLMAPQQPPERLIERFCALPGIGPWTAHYIAMRALSWPDAFPPNDVAVLKAMKALFNTRSQREADAVASAWQPWRAYAVLRLWSSLEKAA